MDTDQSLAERGVLGGSSACLGVPPSPKPRVSPLPKAPRAFIHLPAALELNSSSCWSRGGIHLCPDARGRARR